MKPSLTPHEDAYRRIEERTPLPDDPESAASLRVIRAHNVECARWLDQGREIEGVFNITANVVASVIDSIASGAASGHADPKAARVHFINSMLAQVYSALSGETSPAIREGEDISNSEPAGHA